jgi:hypothetical protein
MPAITQNQVLSALRWIITSGASYAVGRGWITADQIPLLMTAAAAVVPLVWSMIVHTDNATVAAAQALPSAQVVVSDPALLSPGVQIASLNGPSTVSVTVPIPPAALKP